MSLRLFFPISRLYIPTVYGFSMTQGRLQCWRNIFFKKTLGHSFHIIVIPSVLLSFLPDYCHSFRISVIPSELLPFQIFFNPEQLQKGEKMVTRGGLLNLKKFLIRLHPTKKVCRISIMNSFSLHRKVKGSDLVHFLESGKTFSDKTTLLMLRKYFQSHSSSIRNFKKLLQLEKN